jgi:hypothetical protein
VDYIARTAELELEVWVAEAVTNNREENEAYRRGCLRLCGLLFFNVDVPNEEALPEAPHGLQIEAATADESYFIKPMWPTEPLPDGAFRRSFVFTNEWNSGVHFAAEQAKWTWLSDARTIY